MSAPRKAGEKPSTGQPVYEQSPCWSLSLSWSSAHSFGPYSSKMSRMSLGKAEEKPMNEPTGKRRARRGESRGHGCGGGDAGRAEGHDVQVGHHVVVLVLEDGEALRERRLGRLAARQPP